MAGPRDGAIRILENALKSQKTGSSIRTLLQDIERAREILKRAERADKEAAKWMSIFDGPREET